MFFLRYAMILVFSWYVHFSLFISVFHSPFHTTGLFLYPLKTSESLWFFNVFRGNKKRPMVWYGLRCTRKRFVLFCFFLVLDSVKYDPDDMKLLFLCIEYWLREERQVVGILLLRDRLSFKQIYGAKRKTCVTQFRRTISKSSTVISLLFHQRIHSQIL